MTLDKKAFFARTMHTPDSPERAELREALREISRSLIPLHRQVIEVAKSDYAFAYGAVERPARLLELLQNDPFFDWIKPLTAIIVAIDEMTRTDFQTADGFGIAEQLERLFADANFGAHYREILQRDVHVAMAHATLRTALQRLTRS